MDQRNDLLLGDCLEKMKILAENSVDAIVTDPPYGLSFMGKKWDYDVPSKEIWIQALRVLKPGGHLLSFGGTRTYHRMVVNIEDAGFEIRDQIQWLYGSGFPKSHNIKDGDFKGWGTALKPANEPIVVARKPLEKGLTIAENIEKWGVGALNIDGCRIGVDNNDPNKRKTTGGYQSGISQATVQNAPFNKTRDATLTKGRWPANIILDEQTSFMLDEQSGILKSHGGGKATFGGSFGNGKDVTDQGAMERFKGDSGGVSRFFYCAKTSRSERGEGNVHPTVKPIKLMSYLCTLITPPNGTILDPFMGSGSTGVACKELGFNFIGIEMNEEYYQIAQKRIG